MNAGDNVPRFVSHYLDELPPVTFTSMDVCGLLSKMEQLHVAVSAMKQLVQCQAKVSEGLHNVTVDLRSRMSALEQHIDQGSAAGSAPARENGAADTDLIAARDMGHCLQGPEGQPLSASKVDATLMCTGGTTLSAGSPK
ncbi:hypothetical protein AMECASPLE_031279 [Ameca splendens]|uniref:Uncharacterized protein n=1 Tax=Ameca splendens TaxID=208324 RepID=A0ABV0ZRU2_9TELE